MKRRLALRFLAASSGLWILGGPPALAADTRCNQLAVEVEPGVEAAWPEVSDRVHAAFDARKDTDGCAQVRLELRKAAIDLEVVLPDGRRARRSELQPEDVVPVLEGLLALPEPPPARPTAPPAARLDVRARPLVDRVAASEAEPSPKSPGIGIEISLGTSARFGDAQQSLGLVGNAWLELSSFLIGLAARIDSYKWASGGVWTPALEFAALGGYRFRRDAFALSVYAGPAWAVLQLSTVSVAQVGMPPIVPEPEPGESFTPRLCLGARIDLWPGSVLRTFVDVHGVFGAAGQIAEGATPGSVTRLAEWMLGAAVGATLGTI